MFRSFSSFQLSGQQSVLPALPLVRHAHSGRDAHNPSLLISNIHISRKCIYNGRTNAMKSTACLICSSYQTLPPAWRVVNTTRAADTPFRMHIPPEFLVRYLSTVQEPSFSSVTSDCQHSTPARCSSTAVVHDLIDQVVQAFS